MIMLPGAAMASRIGFTKKERVGEPVPADSVHVLPDQLLLKDYRPKSVYKIPVSEFRKAKFPFIDVHHHARVKTPEDVDAMVKIMDAVGLETTIAFSEVGPAFDESYRLYSKYPKRFKVWCGLNMADVDQPGFGPATLKELERCCKGGAVGVGEITDKGMGIGVSLAGLRTGRARVLQEEAAPALVVGPRKKASIPMTRAWIRSGRNARTLVCPSTSTYPIPIGLTSLRTNITTA